MFAKKADMSSKSKGLILQCFLCFFNSAIAREAPHRPRVLSQAYHSLITIVYSMMIHFKSFSFTQIVLYKHQIQLLQFTHGRYRYPFYIRNILKTFPYISSNCLDSFFIDGLFFLTFFNSLSRNFLSNFSILPLFSLTCSTIFSSFFSS